MCGFSCFINLIFQESLPQKTSFRMRNKQYFFLTSLYVSFHSYTQDTEEELSCLFSNSHYTKPEIMVFSAWMQTNHLSGRPWKDLICSTSQYSVFVKGCQTHTWTFLLTHVSPPVYPTPHLLKLSQVGTACQPLPSTSFRLLFCALVTSSAVSPT